MNRSRRHGEAHRRMLYFIVRMSAPRQKFYRAFGNSPEVSGRDGNLLSARERLPRGKRVFLSTLMLPCARFLIFRVFCRNHVRLYNFCSTDTYVIIVLTSSWKVAHTLPLSSRARNETSCEIREGKVISFRHNFAGAESHQSFGAVQTYDRKHIGYTRFRIYRWLLCG